MGWLQRMMTNWRPEQVAIHSDTFSITYAELHDRIERATGWLRSQGLVAGDVLALQMEREPAFLELHLAALGEGVVTLPLNPAYPPSELNYYVSDSGAKLAVALDHHVPSTHGSVLAASSIRTLLDESPKASINAELDDQSWGMLLYTSGTTGRPKGAQISHANLRATVESLHSAWQWQNTDVLVHALPLFHVHGLFVAQHGALRAGATTFWMNRFNAEEALQALDRHRGTIFMGVPTFYARFLALDDAHTFNLDHVRLFTSGSAPLPATDHQAFEARFGHRVLERYGMTEVGIVLSNPYDAERRPGSVGFPVPGASVEVRDEDGTVCEPDRVGEVHIRGPSVFLGYLNRPEATASTVIDGWLKSGDLGFVDADGYIHLVGRNKDMVLTGGLNVYPIEVETALLEHPDVAQAAVVGVWDPDLGERVVASLVPSTTSAPSAASIRDFAKTKIASYKVPKALEWVDELPRNAMGKVQKSTLRERWDQYSVREGCSSDTEQIIRWNAAMAKETEEITLDAATLRSGVQQVFSAERGAHYFIVERAGVAVGGCMITREWSDWRAADVWWFQSVFVDPQYRKRGVFRTIYEEVASRAKASGATGLRLYVDRRNTGAIKTYRALGMNDEHYEMFESMFGEY